MKQLKRQFISLSQVEATAASVRGARNQQNQDAYLMLEQQGVFAVCDGMGGHAGGQVASQLIIRTIRDNLKKNTIDIITVDYLINLIAYANRTVYQHAQQHLQLRGMGTTIVLAWIVDTQLTVCHVGDSRAYRLRAGRLKCLTQDHSSSSGKGLSRALGVKKTVNIEQHDWDWESGDRLLLVSDGISNVLEDIQLAHLLAKTPGPMVIQTVQLIAAASEAGGNDDKTAVLIRSFRDHCRP